MTPRLQATLGSTSPSRFLVRPMALLLASFPLLATLGPTPLAAVAPPPAADTVRMADPYRWLEELDSPEVRAWTEAQNQVTAGYLEALTTREHLTGRLAAMRPPVAYRMVAEHGGRIFFQRRAWGEDHDVVYWQPSIAAEPRVLIDPGTLGEGEVRLDGFSVSPDGRHVRFVVSSPGAPPMARVREVDGGRDIAELGPAGPAPAAWTLDSKGFFYLGVRGLAYHRLGTSAMEDWVIFESPQPHWFPSPSVSSDGRYLLIHLWAIPALQHRIYYLDLGDGESPRLDGEVVALIDDFDAMRWFVGSRGSVFYFHTDEDAPRGRVVALDITAPEAGVRTVVPEMSGTLQQWAGVSVVDRYIVAQYLEDVVSRVRLFTFDGDAAGELEVPGPGSVEVFAGSPDSRQVYYGFTSFTQPRTIFQLDLETRETRVFRNPTAELDPERFITRQVFYTSRDGTDVPMFLTHLRGDKPEGGSPVLLRAYGGHGIPLLPGYSPSDAAWLDAGGTLAVANVRGGGEYGEEWHRAGSGRQKQNTIDDLIAAAEYLVDQGISAPGRIGLFGHSMGGMVASAAITQRPELFGAAVISAPVTDLLRFHEHGAGAAWIPEYGSPDDPAMVPVLLSYSPLHNVRPGTCYPPTLILVTATDETVHPGHAFRFTAALQAAQGCENPVLLRTEESGYHWGGTASGVQQRQADWLAFVAHALGARTP